MAYSFDQLKALWIQAGGNPAAAAVAAAAAIAESGGNPNATGPVGERGLWQIATSHGAQSTYDPLGNARAAVAISGNGTNWRPWCTAYSDGACGTKGGAYAPTGGSPIGRALAAGGGGSIPVGGGTVPAGSVQPAGLLDFAGTVLDVNQWAHFADVVLNNVLYASMVVAGGALMILGLVAMARESPALGNVAGIVNLARDLSPVSL